MSRVERWRGAAGASMLLGASWVQLIILSHTRRYPRLVRMAYKLPYITLLQCATPPCWPACTEDRLDFCNNRLRSIRFGWNSILVIPPAIPMECFWVGPWITSKGTSIGSPGST